MDGCGGHAHRIAVRLVGETGLGGRMTSRSCPAGKGFPAGKTILSRRGGKRFLGIGGQTFPPVTRRAHAGDLVTRMGLWSKRRERCVLQ
jgi:hypothetical protein